MMVEEIVLLGIGQEHEYLKCAIELDELISTINSTLQLKPYGVLLRQMLVEELNIQEAAPKEKIGFPIIFNMLSSSKYISKAPNVSYLQTQTCTVL